MEIIFATIRFCNSPLVAGRYNGPPSRALMMLSLRAEATAATVFAIDVARCLLMADDA